MNDFKILHCDSDFGVVRPISYDEEDKIYEVMRGGAVPAESTLLFELVPNSIKKGEPGDTLFYAGMNIFSERFVSDFREYLEECGELVHIQISGLHGEYFWFAVTRTIDCLDRELSLYGTSTTDPEKIVSLRKVVLKPVSEVAHIFRLPQGPYNVTFVSNELAEKISASSYLGFHFGDGDSLELYT